jgi:hypothetical protein
MLVLYGIFLEIANVGGRPGTVKMALIPSRSAGMLAGTIESPRPKDDRTLDGRFPFFYIMSP